MAQILMKCCVFGRTGDTIVAQKCKNVEAARSPVCNGFHSRSETLDEGQEAFKSSRKHGCLEQNLPPWVDVSPIAPPELLLFVPSVTDMSEQLHTGATASLHQRCGGRRGHRVTVHSVWTRGHGPQPCLPDTRLVSV